MVKIKSNSALSPYQTSLIFPSFSHLHNIIKANGFFALVILSLFLTRIKADAQVLTLPDAISTAKSNYGTLKAKANYINAFKA